MLQSPPLHILTTDIASNMSHAHVSACWCGGQHPHLFLCDRTGVGFVLNCKCCNLSPSKLYGAPSNDDVYQFQFCYRIQCRQTHTTSLPLSDLLNPLLLNMIAEADIC
ncbi:uncharacterized protein EKO05_0009099 [Ascochyta rabiei]|uniref:uncharacterized protein n=1 Tax=Didymella rabiei TaxID=5454 RepID=UPI0022074031|nr:uncharacterized protein EKO05_0009099 [Ascochyta rabiei]UPX18809.1 hypothetical protein EKO05_0009099 [Ascochyta rabiei]